MMSGPFHGSHTAHVHWEGGKSVLGLTRRVFVGFAGARRLTFTISANVEKAKWISPSHRALFVSTWVYGPDFGIAAVRRRTIVQCIYYTQDGDCVTRRAGQIEMGRAYNRSCCISLMILVSLRRAIQALHVAAEIFSYSDGSDGRRCC